MAKKTRTRTALRRQRPLKGGRTYLVGGFDPRVEAWLQQMMQRFNCSMSMVLNNVCSFTGNIDLFDPLDGFAPERKKR